MTKLIKSIENNINTYLTKLLPVHKSKIENQYAVLPAGKLFRPLLAYAVYFDEICPSEDKYSESLYSSSDISKAAAALEIHHAYTLVHDDLPAMDDDDTRRGKPSLHKKYGQWNAILVGDSLLNISYQLLTQLNGSHTKDIQKIFSWALGPKGLILGQYMDLSGEMGHSFKNTLETHRLKTARLIQTSLLMGYLCSKNGEKLETSKMYQLYKLGDRLGILFQLLDDLCEFNEELSQHERDINPWLKNPKKCFKHTEKYLMEVIKFIMNSKSENLRNVLAKYFKKIENILSKGTKEIPTEQVLPIVSLLNRFSEV